MTIANDTDVPHVPNLSPMLTPTRGAEPLTAEPLRMEPPTAEPLRTVALQQQIDDCSAMGGGVVRVPPGEHRIGTLRLRNGVVLEVPAGSRLVGSDDLADYALPESSTFVDAVGQLRGRALILAEDVQRVGLIGEGVIDGNGVAFIDGPGYHGRPFLCRFIRCNDVTLSGITLLDSAAWVCHLVGCADVRIENLRIRSLVNHNNDGIDIDGCQRISVRGCDIETGDDALCLKATTHAPCEDVTVEDCRLSSQCGAIKLGTESYGDFRRINIRRIDVRHAGLGAIKVLTMDGGVIEDVEISDIEVRSGTGPIFVRLGGRCRTYRPGDVRKGPGAIRRVRIARVRVAPVSLPAAGGTNYFTGERLPPESFAGVLVTGLPDHPIEALTLEDISVVFPGGGDAGLGEREVPEMPEAYPEQYYFGPLPAFGMYARHVRGLRLSELNFTTLVADGREEIVLEDAK